MTSVRFRTPSPALVISVLALFVALGGTGYAATQAGGPSAQAAKKKSGSDTKADKKLIKSMLGSAHVAFATTAGSATTAATASNALALGNRAASSFAGRWDSGTVALAGGGSDPNLLTVGPVTYGETCGSNTMSVTIADSAAGGTVIGGTTLTSNGSNQALSSTPATDWTVSSASQKFGLFSEEVLLGDGTAYTAEVMLGEHEGSSSCEARVIAVTAG
jgi:hypothetical protein